MSAPDPEGMSMLAKVMAAGAAVAAPLFGVWKWLDARLEKKADAESMKALAERVEDHTISKDVFNEHTKADERHAETVNNEIGVQRGHIARLFEKIEELSDKTEVKFTVLERQSTERHIELLNAIHGIKK